MPDFKFRSQFPIADVIAAAQRRPQIEAQILSEQEATRQARFRTLLDALSTGAQVARVMSDNKTDALKRDVVKSAMQGQDRVQQVLNEPPAETPIAAPITKFMPTQGPTTEDQQPPAPTAVGTNVPTFGATPNGAGRNDRLISALAQAAPEEYAKNVFEQTFGTGPVARSGYARPVNYSDSQGKTRVGVWDPKSMKVIRDEQNDPIAGFANGVVTNPLTGMPMGFNRGTAQLDNLGVPQAEAPTAITGYGDLNPVQRAVLDKTSEDVTKDPIIQGLADSQNNLNRLQSLIDSNDPASLGAIQSQMARAVAGEKGVLTDQDVARNTGDRALASRFKRFVKTHYNGKLTDSDKADFGNLLSVINQKTNENLERRMSGYYRRTKAKIPNIDDGFLRDAITITSPSAGFNDSGANSPGAGFTIDEAALDAELKRRGLMP